MTTPPRAVMRARNALRAELADLGPGATIAVACSGGADSLALASELAFLARRQGWRTAAFLVDHGLQPGSDTVIATAAHACQELGIDIVETVRVKVPQGAGTGGLEAAARTARYRALTELAQRHEAHAVLLGHTLDDQAETVLLGLARGSGTRSLAGMRPSIGIFRRPYLALTRADTEAVCAHAGLEFWVDPTNLAAHDGPLRSQVRGRVVPLLDEVLGPRIADTLARTAAQLQDDADALDALAEELLTQALVAREPNAGEPDAEGLGTVPDSSESRNAMHVTLRLAPLETAPRALRTRALRTAALRAGVPAGPLKYRHVEEIERLVTHWRGQKPIDLPGAFTAWRASGHITISPPTLE